MTNYELQREDYYEEKILCIIIGCNGIGKPELKYVNSDGREAVFDGDTHLPISDPDYIATYNYFPPYQLPEAPGLNDYYKLGTSYVGHFFCDMLPYYLFLDSNTREQFEAKIPLF